MNTPFDPLNQPESPNRLTFSAAPDVLLQSVIEKLGKSVFVVMNKRGDNLVRDPGMNQPYHHRNRKIVEQVARECGGVCVDIETALAQLTKNIKPRD
jgi:hypothetical protein